jgi:uncharacterized membrane-anchored protein
LASLNSFNFRKRRSKLKRTKETLLKPFSKDQMSFSNKERKRKCSNKRSKPSTLSSSILAEHQFKRFSINKGK